jgi:hypothetical protein
MSLLVDLTAMDVNVSMMSATDEFGVKYALASAILIFKTL